MDGRSFGETTTDTSGSNIITNRILHQLCATLAPFKHTTNGKRPQRVENFKMIV